jgi:hypothetical protein
MADPVLAQLGVQAPPPPIEKVRGVDYPKPSDDPGRVKIYLQKLLQQSKPMADLLQRQASKHAHYANGRQWIDWNTQRKEWYDRPVEEHDIRVSINHIRPILRSKTQRLLSSRIDPVLIPSSNDHAERDRCKAGSDFLRARFEMLKLTRKLDQALEHAQYGGVCALKSFWNPTLGPLTPAVVQLPKLAPTMGPDGQPLLDEQGQPTSQPTGELQSVPLGVEPGTGQIQPVEDEADAVRYRLGDTDLALRTVWNIRWNPEATGWTAADGLRYLLDRESVPLAVAKEKYPEIADRITLTQDERGAGGAQESRYNTAGITQAGPNPTALSPVQKDPTVELVEYWELESLYFPKGRLVVLVGDAVAYDGPFPDGFFPYDPVYDEPAPGTPAGRSTITDMVDPSDVINRQWTAILQEMWDSGTGQFVGLDIPGVPDQVTREPRAMLKIPARTVMQGRSVRDVIARIDPPQISPDRWRLIEAAERTLQDIGSYHEVTRGQVPPGVDSGIAIEKLQEQERGQMQKSILALEETIVSIARKQLALARKRYQDLTRWIPVQRDDLGYLVEGVTGPNLPDPDTVSIVLERFRPHSEASFRADIKELMREKSIPPALGLKLLDMGRGVEAAFISQTRHYSKARWENIQIERGTAQFIELGHRVDPVTGVQDPVLGLAVPVAAMQSQTAAPTEDTPSEGTMVPCLLEQDDDHAIHMDVLDDIILDYAKPWPVRQLALAHKQEHREAIARQQLAMQAAMPAPDAPEPTEAAA